MFHLFIAAFCPTCGMTYMYGMTTFDACNDMCVWHAFVYFGKAWHVYMFRMHLYLEWHICMHVCFHDMHNMCACTYVWNVCTYVTMLLYAWHVCIHASLDVSSVKDMGGIFMAMINSDIFKWDVSGVINMKLIFMVAKSFEQKLCGASWVKSKTFETLKFAGSSRSRQPLQRPPHKWQVIMQHVGQYLIENLL